MSNWYYDEPTDERAIACRRAVYTEDMILNEHFSEFMHDTDGTFEAHDAEDLNNIVIEDWCICNWASPTDMPPGVYITTWRRP